MIGARYPNDSDDAGGVISFFDSDPSVPNNSVGRDASLQEVAGDIMASPPPSSRAEMGVLEFRRSASKASMTPRSGNKYDLHSRSRKKIKKVAVRRTNSHDSTGSAGKHQNCQQFAEDAEEQDPDDLKKLQYSHHLPGFLPINLFPSTSNGAETKKSDATIFQRLCLSANYSRQSTFRFLQTPLQLIAPIFRPIIHIFNFIQSKLRSAKTYLQMKYSRFSPFQKLLVIVALILWKFVQIWILTTLMIWFHRSTSGIEDIIVAENDVIVSNGKMSEMPNDPEKQRDLVERQKLQSVLLEQRRHHDAWSVDDQDPEQLEGETGDQYRHDGLHDQPLVGQQDEHFMDHPGKTAEKGPHLLSPQKILYIVTMTCPYSSSQNDRKSSKNVNVNSSHLLQSDYQLSFNSTMSTIYENVRNIMNSSRDTSLFQVDVYLILGCMFEDLDLEVDDSGDSLEWNNSRFSLDFHVRNFLPNGVGLQIWEDAMPYEMTYSAKGDEKGIGGSHSRMLSEVVRDENIDSVTFQRTHEERRRGREPNWVPDEVSFKEKRRLHEKKTQRRPRIEANMMHENNTNTRETSTANAIDPQRETPTKKKQNFSNNLLDAIVRPSLSNFMKQHRFVVRDKLKEYDIFVSFFAHLKQPGNRDADESIAGKPLERITREHVTTHLEMSLMLNKWKKNLKLYKSAKKNLSLDEMIPALLAADIWTKHSKDNIVSDADLWVDANPCCGHLFRDIESLSDARHVSFEVAIVDDKSNSRKDASYIWDFHDIGIGTSKSTTGEHSGVHWIATLPNCAQSRTPLFKNGWILTRDQILRINHGICHGKFLPPFEFDDESDHIGEKPNEIARQDFTSPLFHPKEDGGCGMKPAVSLNPLQFSRQLVYTGRSIDSLDYGRRFIFEGKEEIHVGAKEMLYGLHRAKMTMQVQ
ncbi:hypothetical protein ACHAXS_005215 [Conticribra weissflogii]